MILKSKDVDKFFMILTIVYGLFVRILPIFRAKFPLVDGGMFFSMIHDLQAAHYSLPRFLSYNHQQIPYAYPPFAFYFTGAINSLTGIPLLKLIQWQPVAINILTLVVVYFFSKKLTNSSTKSWLATFIFSLTPNTYWWQIVGGGLTRSFGALFAFLFTFFTYRIYHDKDESFFSFFGSIISGVLVVLSHPEWALQAVFSGFLFFLIWGRNWHSIRRTIIIILSVLVITAFWWISILQSYGLHIYLTASTATNSRLLFFLPLFSFQYTGEYTAFISVFTMIGVFVTIAQKKYYLLIWGIGCLLIDPRGGVPFALLPFSIVAMFSISDLIAPFFLRASGREDNPWWKFLDLPVGKFFIGIFAILCLSHAYESNIISFQHLSIDEQQAMFWVKDNTEFDDKFLVLGWEDTPTHSSLTEWFPALAERQSITTVQGQEWFGKYHDAFNTFSLYQNCLSEDSGCIQEIIEKKGNKVNCIFISFEKSEQKPEKNVFYLSLQQSSEYNQVYSSSIVKIFCLKE